MTMLNKILEMIKKSNLSNDDYARIAHYCKQSIEKTDDIHDYYDSFDTDDCFTEHINKMNEYLAQFIIRTESYFDRLGYNIEQHILLVFEDFSCSLSFSGNNEGCGSYTLRIKRNNENILVFSQYDLCSFKNENIKQCKTYNKSDIQELSNAYEYDNDIMFVSDIVVLFHKLYTDDDIIRDSKPNASNHFG